MLRSLFVAALLVGAPGCGAETPTPKTPVGRSLPDDASRRPELPGPPGLPSSELLTLPDQSAPVVFAAGSQSGGLIAFVADGKIFARAVAASDKAKTDPEASKPVELGVARELGAFSLKPLADGGFVLFWDERVDQNHVFHLQRLGADAKPTGKALVLPPVAEAALSFSDVVVVGDRALVLYEVSKVGRASVFVTPIAAGLEKATGGARPVVENAFAWHGAQSATALALVAVEPGAGKAAAEGERTLGSVTATLVDADAKVGLKRTILADASAQIDVEVAAIKGGFIVGWTDEGLEESAVRLATLSESGELKVAPKWLAPPIGRQSFVGLTSDPAGSGARALIAWENQGQAAGESRIIHLATVGLDGVPSRERTRILLDDAERPDLVADGDGFAALTLAPAQLKDGADASAAIDGPSSWPTLVRLGADLAVRWAEPVRIAGTASKQGIPELAWGLGCAKSGCFGVAADGQAPTTYWLFGAAERDSAWVAPAWRAEDERPPRIASLRSALSDTRIASVRATAVSPTQTAAAWATYYLEGTTPVEAAPKGEPPYAATLGVRFLGAGASERPPIIVSKRAVSFGGVSIAPAAPSGKGGDAKKAEVVVAWVANDKQGQQVYATKLDEDGKKVAQKKITVVGREAKKGKGGKDAVASYPSSVAIAHAPPLEKAQKGGAGSDGFVVAWVDTRDGNGELYAARINKELEKTVVDKRLTNAAGDASDVALSVHGNDAFIAFADSQGGASSDIWFSHLDAQSLAKADEPTRVYASAARSRAPRLAVAGDKLMLAWIEESEGGTKAHTEATLRVAEVDKTGRLLSAPKIVEAPEKGSITDLALTCGATMASCRLVVSWSTKAGLVDIGALTLDASGAPQPLVRLGTLASGPFAEPSFSFADDGGKTLLFAEDLGEKGRVRQVELGW